MNTLDAGKSSKRSENSKNKDNFNNIHEAIGNADQILGKSKKSHDSANEFFNSRTDSKKPENPTESRSMTSSGKCCCRMPSM